MVFSEQLRQLRRARGLSQEQLAEAIHVARQTVSKWEAGINTPEIPTLIALADFFGITVDALIRPSGETNEQSAAAENNTGQVLARLDELENRILHRRRFEYKSRRSFLGLPLIHVVFASDGLTLAKGIIAIGNFSLGIISVGGISIGVFSLGGLGLGLAAIGGLALGGIAFGGAAIGLLAIGGCAIGVYAFGGAALAKELAAGAAAASQNLAISRGDANAPLALIASSQEEILQAVQRIGLPRWLGRLAALFGGQ